MSDRLTLVVEKCKHGVWHSHDSLRLEDGSVAPDPDGLCEGGVVIVNDKLRGGISPAFAMALEQYEQMLAYPKENKQ